MSGTPKVRIERRSYRHAEPATDLDHAAVDGGMAASTKGPVRVCRQCGERIVP